jgi:PAS domain S-box-containing protein
VDTSDSANLRLRELEAEVARLSADLNKHESTGRDQHAADERYRLALEAADIGTFDLDLVTGQLVWDDRCRQLFGLPPGVPVSYEASFLPNLHADDRDRVQAAVSALLEGRVQDVFDIEYRTVGAEDGALRWVAARGRLVQSGGRAVRFIGAVRDITRKREAEIAVREAEERYRLALRATKDVVWDWDLVADEVRWNEALADSLGYDMAEVEPTGSWWISQIHPDDRERISDHIHSVIAGTGERWSDEYRFRRVDGTYADVHDRGSVIRDEHGRATRMIGAMLDLSERKKAEEQQNLLLGELQHRVKNTLAMVQAIASQTFRESATPDAREAFTARVIALSHANDILTKAGWTAAPVKDIVQGATIPHCAGPERFDISGPGIEIAARAALSLTLVLHELCTNASKYGALSNDQGRVEIAWDVVDDGLFRFKWAERGGPPVQKPVHSGFGTRLIERSLGPQLGGEVRTDFAPDGVVCIFQIPLATVQDQASLA